ncbi:bi-domain-containing oxidoreductase [Nocardioides sp. BP30]|uniref:bi-domain-containing oxidoreductase n=1 Tax=Nocardioides sp. BP30 TaxID=3036374 RepID=UPI0024683B65|nr:bi-domain-containing oxidoreductase [Nocardioides sp. BP30]WGL53315.1 bi-domain-containing oxidoreductase [Nocardioides sp. BP30]
MKQVAQNYKSGDLAVLEVPEPSCRPGGILVRSVHSLISTGTELMKVGEARLSLVGKAKARPDQVRKVLTSAAQQGPTAAYRKVMGQLDRWTPLGYSLAGVVVAVGEGAEEFAVGDVVACAGNEFALHAEVNWVPVNLAVAVPHGVAPEHAAFATVGAIAMQGVRRGEMALGETACVIGLGLVGQLMVRLLVASGVRVLGVDPVPERCRLAEKAGARATAGPDEAAGIAGPHGADVIFLAAGGHSNDPLRLAVDLARDRGRLVDVGKTRLDLPWNECYEKELEVRFSRSYGPGRYDDRYELDGIDYPAGYVRWTERRNIECFLDLIAAESLDLTPLVDGIHPISGAAEVYEALRTGELTGVGHLFSYPPATAPVAPATETLPAARPETAAPTVPAGPPVRRPPHAGRPGGPVRLGVIGAGAYAGSMLLPHLAADPAVALGTVATTRSLTAASARERFGFERAVTEAEEVLADESLDAVLIATRHHSHARLVCRALEAGKAVFVEKPLALDEHQLEEIVATVARTGNDRLMVGFNRRFAPLMVELRERFGEHGPLSLRYLVNAGPLAADSWYRDAGREGSRFVGEGGHFLDVLALWTGALPTRVHAVGHDQDVQATITYADGSLASLAYTTGGTPRAPKELLDVSGAGRNARLDNFAGTTLWTPRGKVARRSRLGQDKGQRAELAAFAAAVRDDAPMPIPLESLVATTRATIAVATSLSTREQVLL